MTFKILKNKKGQAILEMLLLFVLISGVWLAVSKSLAQSGAYQKIFGDPWGRLKNTIEFGIPTENSNIANKHPAHPERHATRLSQ